MGEDPSRIRQEIEETRASLGETVEALSYKTDVKARTRDAISDKKDAVVGKITGVKDAIVGQASSVGDTVSSSASSVGDALPDPEAVKQSARRAASVAQQNPLGLVLGAVAVGLVAGMVVPSTRMEDERLGAASDELKNRVLSTGQQAIEHGRQVVQDVAETAAETAKQSGHEHGQQLAQEAQQNAHEAASQASSRL